MLAPLAPARGLRRSYFQDGLHLATGFYGCTATVSSYAPTTGFQLICDPSGMRQECPLVSPPTTIHYLSHCLTIVYSSTVIAQLMPHAQCQNGQYLLAFAFFAWDMSYTHMQDFLPRTILALLCSLNPVPEDIESAYKGTPSTLYIDFYALIEKVLVHLDTGERKSSHTTNRQAPQSLLFVVDGIDEVRSRQDRQRSIDSLVRISLLGGRLTMMSIRVILFSRKDDYVVRRCRFLPYFSEQPIEQHNVDDDIKRAMEYRLTENINMGRLDVEERARLAHRILEKSAGLYAIDPYGVRQV